MRRPKIKTQQTKAYGRWQAVLTLPDGTRFEGWGVSEQLAIYRARLQAERHAL